MKPHHLYELNPALLITQEIDSALRRERELIRMPGGIRLFLVLNFVLVWGFLSALRAVLLEKRGAGAFSLALAGAGAVAFVAHAAFLAAGYEQLRSVLSLLVLVAVFAVSCTQMVVVILRAGARRSALLLLAATALLADAGASAATFPADKWPLWSDGVKLRGANIYQRRRYDFDGPDFLGSGVVGPPYIQQDFDRLAALGANAVFLSHPGLFSENPPYVADADVQANLDNLIAMASRAGLSVIIGFRTGPGRSEAAFDYFPTNRYDNDTVWTDQQAHDAWPAMWRYTANRYRSEPAVAGYELMVEPNGNARLLQIYNPAGFYPRYAGSLYDWNALYPSIVAAIREADPDKPILVGGMNWSSINWLTSLRPVADTRTIYTVHCYDPFVYTNQDPAHSMLTYPGAFDPGSGSVVTVNQEWLRQNLAPIDAFKAANPGAIVAITEFGVQRWVPGAAQYFSDITAVFEEKRLNHLLWLWNASWPPMASSDAFDVRHGSDPGVHGDVPSALLDAVKADFARNAARSKRRAVRR